jgi:hypothetical protein
VPQPLGRFSLERWVVRRQATIDSLTQRLSTAPPPPRPEQHSTADVIAAVAPLVHGLIDQGYSWNAVANLLAQDGVRLKGALLRKYVGASKDKKTTQARTKKRRTADPSSAATKPHLETRADTQPDARSAAPATTVGSIRAQDPDDAWDDVVAVDRPTASAPTAPRPSAPTPQAEATPAQTKKPVSSATRTPSAFYIRPDTEKL